MILHTNHDIWVDGSPKRVRMANDDDPSYVQTFHDWEEIEKFVATLRASAEKAFGPPDTTS